MELRLLPTSAITIDLLGVPSSEYEHLIAVNLQNPIKWYSNVTKVAYPTKIRSTLSLSRAREKCEVPLALIQSVGDQQPAH